MNSKVWAVITAMIVTLAALAFALVLAIWYPAAAADRDQLQTELWQAAQAFCTISRGEKIPRGELAQCMKGTTEYVSRLYLEKLSPLEKAKLDFEIDKGVFGEASAKAANGMIYCIYRASLEIASAQ